MRVWPAALVVGAVLATKATQATPNRLIDLLGEGWSTSEDSWCFAATDGKPSDTLSKCAIAGQRACNATRASACGVHIDDWCLYQFGEPRVVDACARSYRALLPVHTNPTRHAFDPIGFLLAEDGWLSLKAKFKDHGDTALFASARANENLVRVLRSPWFGLFDPSGATGSNDLEPILTESYAIANSVLMRITADMRKLVLDSVLRMAKQYIADYHTEGKEGASALLANEKNIEWGSAGSDDVTSDLDVNVKNVGSGIGTLFFNRVFETLFRAAGYSQFMTAGSFFDLNVYAEDFLSKDVFTADRSSFMLHTMGTMGPGSIFYAQQADSMVWALSKLLRDVSHLAGLLGMPDGGLLDLFLPTGTDVPDAVIVAALGISPETSREVIDRARHELTEEMKRRVSLARDCQEMRDRVGVALLSERFPELQDQTHPNTASAVGAIVNSVVLKTLNTTTPKADLERDVETWVYQRVSTTASVLSDRLPALVAEKFSTRSSRPMPSAMGSIREKLDVQLVRDYLRHASASFAPEAYTSKGAVLSTVGLSQAGLTGAWHPRKGKSTKAPSSLPLPLHALDLVTSVIEQVSFTVQHWGEDWDRLAHAHAVSAWINAIKGSSKYFARIGEMLTVLDHVNHTNMMPTGIDEEYAFYPELLLARDPEAKPALNEGRTTPSFAFDLTNTEDARVYAAARALALDPLLRNSELTVDVGKSTRFFTKVQDALKGTLDAKTPALLKIYFSLVGLESSKLSFLGVFALGIRKALGRALFRALAHGKCFTSDGSFDQARCSPWMMPQCRARVSDESMAVLKELRVPVGEELERTLASFDEVDTIMSKALVPQTCSAHTIRDVIGAAGPEVGCADLTDLEQRCVHEDRAAFSDLHMAFLNRLDIEVYKREVELARKRRPTSLRRLDAPADRTDLSLAAETINDERRYGTSMSSDVVDLNFGVKTRSFGDIEYLKILCNPEQDFTLGPRKSTDEKEFLRQLNGACYRHVLVTRTTLVVELVGRKEWARLADMLANAGIPRFPDDTTVESFTKALASELRTAKALTHQTAYSTVLKAGRAATQDELVQGGTSELPTDFDPFGGIVVPQMRVKQRVLDMARERSEKRTFVDAVGYDALDTLGTRVNISGHDDNEDGDDIENEEIAGADAGADAGAHVAADAGADAGAEVGGGPTSGGAGGVAEVGGAPQARVGEVHQGLTQRGVPAQAENVPATGRPAVPIAAPTRPTRPHGEPAALRVDGTRIFPRNRRVVPADAQRTRPGFLPSITPVPTARQSTGPSSHPLVAPIPTDAQPTTPSLLPSLPPIPTAAQPTGPSLLGSTDTPPKPPPVTTPTRPSELRVVGKGLAPAHLRKYRTQHLALPVVGN